MSEDLIKRLRDRSGTVSITPMLDEAADALSAAEADLTELRAAKWAQKHMDTMNEAVERVKTFVDALERTRPRALISCNGFTLKRDDLRTLLSVVSQFEIGGS